MGEGGGTLSYISKAMSILELKLEDICLIGNKLSKLYHFYPQAYIVCESIGFLQGVYAHNVWF